MVKIRKYANFIERFLHGEKGQRFFNIAYSIGAAVVIWGALFKILHLPGGSTLLCIGMGTEIAMFLLTAFDRPPKDYHWEDVFPVLDTHAPEDRPALGGNGGGISGGFVGGVSGGNVGGVSSGAMEGVSGSATGGVSGGIVGGVSGGVVGGVSGGGISGGIILAGGGDMSSADLTNQAAPSSQTGQTGSAGTIVIGGSGGGVAPNVDISEEDTENLVESMKDMAEQMKGVTEQIAQLRETTDALNKVSEVLLNSYKAITDNSESVSASSNGYVERLEDLNRNIGGLNTIYEIQLKSISSQLESIDRVNRGLKDIRDMYEKSANESSRYCEETERMSRYMRQLNKIYENMITAMTMNMANPMATPQPRSNPFEQNRQTDN
ncbi:MAG: gliding motility protein GldL [Muribaculaceae bacterium]|nr:gliding motility protein GldL [Muribaculaceae bacterium]